MFATAEGKFVMSQTIGIPAGASYDLTTALSGTILAFAGTLATLTLEPQDILGSLGSNGTMSVSLGGVVENMQPTDRVIINDIEQVYAGLLSGPSAMAELTAFDSAISFAALTHIDFVIDPGGSISGALGASAVYLPAIDEAIFGAGVLADTIDIKPLLINGSYEAIITSPEPVNPCFLRGTRISTARGEIPVEELAVGDLVPTIGGIMRPIIWVGQRRVDITRHTRPATVRPIRIKKGALAEGIPRRDLLLSPDHGLLLENVLAQAKDIVDGDVIAPDMNARSAHYFHVELAEHDALFAEGAAVESYLDTGQRGVFAHETAPVILHPDLMNLCRESQGFAPLCTKGDTLALIRTRLHERKRALGYVMIQAPVWLKAGPVILSPFEAEPGLLQFDLPDFVRRPRLMAGQFVPAYTDPGASDHRVLGMSIARVTLDDEILNLDRVIDAGDRHPRAPEDVAIWLRGDCDLHLPWAGRQLSIRYTGLPQIWQSMVVDASQYAINSENMHNISG
ncbi:MAG: hypothetical protein B7Z78_01350 [Rhodospirillales bacterium 20-60-12]|nr:MAG: hypothetical protein B7Z78_01350 [Rhodospirillales bacterium 20-60-12]